MSEHVLDAPLFGDYNVPGCKSISHRALILPTACGVPAVIHNLNQGHDVLATMMAVQAIGTKIESMNDGGFVLTPTDLDVFSKNPSKEITVDMGNAGTAARLLMGFFSSIPGLNIRMIGDESLQSRPMRRVSDPLKTMDALIDHENEKGTLPAKIHGTSLTGITYDMPVASAQVKSAILLAGLRANGPIVLIEPAPSRDHTEHMLQLLGINCVSSNGTIRLNPKTKTQHTSAILQVPGDPSAAAFWCVAALIIPGSHVSIKGINGNPLRCEFINVLKQMGGNILIKDVGTAVGEPLIDIEIKASVLKGITTKLNQSASLMDEYPVLSVAAALANGITVFEGVGELRVKESNRLSKIYDLLTLFGTKVEIVDDTLIIHGQIYSQSSEPISFDPSYDHRMAMCALILARALKRSIQVKDISCIETSFPTFLRDFNS